MKLNMYLAGMLILSACGGQSPKKMNKHTSHDLLMDKAVQETGKVTYVAVLNPVNETGAGYSSGAVTVDIDYDNDFMTTNVRFNGQPASSIHIQAIHEGSTCPTAVADTNNDGYVDVFEAWSSTYDVIIPLDGDLNTQFDGRGVYPVSDPWGTFIYSQNNSYVSLMSDLYMPDDLTDDEVIKLEQDTPLDLESRTVVIYGVSDSIVLPDTVEKLPGFTSNEILPVACGTFKKIIQIPGTIEEDDRTIGTIGSGRRQPTPSRTNETERNQRHPRCRRDKNC